MENFGPESLATGGPTFLENVGPVFLEIAHSCKVVARLLTARFWAPYCSTLGGDVRPECPV